jgi:hypothetical protein
MPHENVTGLPVWSTATAPTRERSVQVNAAGHGPGGASAEPLDPATAAEVPEVDAKLLTEAVPGAPLAPPALGEAVDVDGAALGATAVAGALGDAAAAGMLGVAAGTLGAATGEQLVTPGSEHPPASSAATLQKAAHTGSLIHSNDVVLTLQRFIGYAAPST